MNQDDTNNSGAVVGQAPVAVSPSVEPVAPAAASVVTEVVPPQPMPVSEPIAAPEPLEPKGESVSSPDPVTTVPVANTPTPVSAPDPSSAMTEEPTLGVTGDKNEQ